MQINVQHRPAYALGVVDLEAGEAVQAETGAMVSMSTNLKVESGLEGGLLKSAMRSVLGGDVVFLVGRPVLAPPQGFRSGADELLRRHP